MTSPPDICEWQQDFRSCRRRKAPAGAFRQPFSTIQPTERVKMLAWSALLDIAKNGKKLVPFVPRPS
jgi:hypothetical protein